MADQLPVAVPSLKPRSSSISQASEGSQTAADFIKEQLNLEAEAREALPYQFDTCTRDLGPLRQGLYSCLDCSPPPANSSDTYVPAAVCYACSISCHGEHTLVELFNKRNFVCDCGTTRLPETAPCTLRMNPATGQKGGVTGEEPAPGNKYNQNFRNQFCGCGEQYDPFQEKGTMFQCLGLGSVEDGGCGEDWWHPECVVGLTREEFKNSIEKTKEEKKDSSPKMRGIMKEVSVTRQEEEVNGHRDPDARRPSIVTAIAAGIPNGSGVDGNDVAAEAEDEGEEDPPLPPGFPPEDDFEYFICYKCVEAFPWIKQYVGAAGFLPPVYHDASLNAAYAKESPGTSATETKDMDPKKRKATDDDDSITNSSLMAPSKRQKSEDPVIKLSSIPEDSTATAATLPFSPKKPDATNSTPTPCKLASLPAQTLIPNTPFSLFLTPSFRASLCRCPTHYPLLIPHPQLLEEEDVYEPPMSESDAPAGSVGTGSLLDRGEAAFSNMDRVRALQGAMAYAHLKDGLKAFLKPYAEEGKVVAAEDIKAYFEKLRGDSEGIKAAAGDAKRSKESDNENGEGGAGGDIRREQSGY